MRLSTDARLLLLNDDIEGDTLASFFYGGVKKTFHRSSKCSLEAVRVGNG